MPLERRRPTAHLYPILFILSFVVLFANSARAMEKERVVPMSDYFREETPLTYVAGRSTAAAAETTIRHQVFFSDLDGATAGWGIINNRAGQPNAWHTVTGGSHACVGTSWWMGQAALAHGDGYDNNWVQQLVTNVPIPGRPATRPSCSNARYAFSTVLGLMATWATTSFTVGSWSPFCSRPSRSAPRTCWTSWR